MLVRLTCRNGLVSRVDGSTTATHVASHLNQKCPSDGDGPPATTRRAATAEPEMDHGGMNHGDMDHSTPMCSMNMLLTTSTQDLCILVPQWRITSTWSLLQSLLLITLIGVLFEYIRAQTRRFESKTAHDSGRSRSPDPLVTHPRQPTKTRRRMVLALLYGLQVGISFMLMLVFMTYNVQVMAAVIAGSVLGHYLFAPDSGVESKGMACH